LLTANATYYYGEQETLVTVALQKHHLSINLGDNRQVLWYYDQVMKLEPTLFSYPGHLQQSLKIHTYSFAEELTARMQQQTSTVRRHRGSTLLNILIALLLFAALFYFFALPRIAAGMADKVSVSYEQQLGDQMYQSMKPGFHIDERRTAYINAFFKELNFSSPYQIQITVVKGEVANAFAMPGGHIVIYDKILEGMSSYEELAALLAHEFTHIAKRHSLRSMFRQLSSQLFFTLLLGDMDVAGGILLRNADNLKHLSYSRHLETEADEYGAHLLAQQNVSCNGFIRLFELLKKETGTVQSNEWFSSHPDLDNRIRNIQQLSICQHSFSNHPDLDGLFNRIKLAQ